MRLTEPTPAIDIVANRSRKTQLQANSPNLFNVSAMIRFTLAEETQVRLEL